MSVMIELMVQFNSNYYVYSDKLSKIQGAEGGDNTGIYVSCAIGIDQPWKVQKKVTLKDYNGDVIEGRHGSVMVLNYKNNTEAYKKVIQKYIDIYGTHIVDEPQEVTMCGLFRSNGDYYLYDSEGNMITSAEVCDEKTGAWYWFEADGRMARNKSVYIPYNADRTEGKMVKGEYCSQEGNWYYYDVITGIMAHGLTTLPNGNVYYYDDITGIRQ